MVFLHQPQQPVGFSFQPQQWGCVAACLQTLVGFSLQSFVPHNSEFARLDTQRGAGEILFIAARALSQTTLLFQHAEKGEDPAPPTCVRVPPP